MSDRSKNYQTESLISPNEENQNLRKMNNLNIETFLKNQSKNLLMQSNDPLVTKLS